MENNVLQMGHAKDRYIIANATEKFLRRLCEELEDK